MKKVTETIRAIRNVIGLKLKSVHLIGSYLLDPNNSNDIDLLISVENLSETDFRKLRMCLPEEKVRIQRNRYDGFTTAKHEMDLVVFEETKTFQKFLKLNKGAIRLH